MRPHNTLVQPKTDIKRRQDVLTRIARERGISFKQWAEKASISPNVFYNFMSGRSETISHETYERLAAVFLGMTAADLKGETSPIMFQKTANILVRGEVNAEIWNEDGWEFPPEDQYRSAAPIAYKYQRLFAVSIKGGSTDRAYDEKTMLICAPIVGFPDPIESGRRVLIERYRGIRTQLVCMEIFHDGERSWFVPLSSNPSYDKIEISWPITDSSFTFKDMTIRPIAVVVGSVREE